jgi:hypothetical protein
VGHVGVAFSSLADYTPRASGLRRKQECGVTTLVLVTTVRLTKLKNNHEIQKTQRNAPLLTKQMFIDMAAGASTAQR